MENSSAMEIRMEWSFPASISQLMQALTDEQLIRIWTGEPATMNKEPGAKFAWFDHWAFGTIVESSASDLKLNWHCTEWPAERVSRVQITLLPESETSRLVLLQSGLNTIEECERFRVFWNEEVSVPLEDYLMIKFHRHG